MPRSSSQPQSFSKSEWICCISSVVHLPHTQYMHINKGNKSANKPRHGKPNKLVDPNSCSSSPQLALASCRSLVVHSLHLDLDDAPMVHVLHPGIANTIKTQWIHETDASCFMFLLLHAAACCCFIELLDAASLSPSNLWAFISGMAKE